MMANGKLRKSLLTFVAIATGGTAVLVFTDKIGYTLDLPVFRSDLVLAASPALQDLLLRKERRLWEIESVLRYSTQNGHPIDSKLVDELNLLRREVADLTERVAQLR